MAPTPLSPLPSPVQSRSRRTEQRIVATAQKLVRAGRLAETSVPELARRANVSVGGFYRRFGSKDDVLSAVAIRALKSELLAEVESSLADASLAGLTVLDILRCYYHLLASMYHNHRYVMAAVARLVRESPQSALAAQARDFNSRMQGRLRDVVLHRCRHHNQAATRRAFDVGLLATTAALREVLLFEQPVSTLEVGSTAELVEQLSWAHYRMLSARSHRQSTRT